MKVEADGFCGRKATLQLQQASLRCSDGEVCVNGHLVKDAGLGEINTGWT